MDGEEKSGEQRKSPTRAPNPRAFARVSGFQNVFGQGACLNLLITDKLLVCLVLGTSPPIEDSNEGEAKSGEQRKSPTRAPNPRAFARVSGFQNVFGQVGER